MKTCSSTLLGMCAALVLGACLSDKKPALDCGAGDALAFAGRGYCIYTAAIIIEGFDCPPFVPFGHEEGGLLICAPSEDPPAEGWAAVVDAWHEEHPGQLPGDTSEPADASDDASADVGVDVGVDTSPPPGLCTSGLAPGQCWGDAQCPSGWVCDGGAVDCTPCGDCAEPIAGSRGLCRPASSESALGLLAWPGFEGASGEVPIALWWVSGSVYGLLECPSYSLEIGDGTGGFVAGPAESACSGLTSLVNDSVIVRPGPSVGTPGEALIVRARGHYRDGCSGSAPESCASTIERVSPEITLRP